MYSKIDINNQAKLLLYSILRIMICLLETKIQFATDNYFFIRIKNVLKISERHILYSFHQNTLHRLHFSKRLTVNQ